MPRLSSCQHFPYLASGLRGVPDVEGKEGIKFFNPVNFVKFIRLLAHNMNSGSVHFVREPLAMFVLPSCRRVS
jgi:hypothetical protein